MSTVMSNQQLAEQGLVPANRFMLPAAVERRGKTGKVLGTVQHFSQQCSAKDIKEALKAQGKKGAELTKAVNEVLRGERDMREQLGIAWVQASIQAGYAPDKGELGKNTGVLRFVKVKEQEAPKPAGVDLAKVAAVLAEFGLGEQDLAVINAKLALQ